ncbi:MAG TPA: hypothetical protein PLM63_04010 [bacterium]|nr:hypothetical protein [bacterium]
MKDIKEYVKQDLFKDKKFVKVECNTISDDEDNYLELNIISKQFNSNTIKSIHDELIDFFENVIYKPKEEYYTISRSLEHSNFEIVGSNIYIYLKVRYDYHYPTRRYKVLVTYAETFETFVETKERAIESIMEDVNDRHTIIDFDSFEYKVVEEGEIIDDTDY